MSEKSIGKKQIISLQRYLYAFFISVMLQTLSMSWILKYEYQYDTKFPCPSFMDISIDSVYN